MNPGEYQIMARVEAGHWWYRSLRDLMGRCLLREGITSGKRPKILDAGCGTGENLKFLGESLDPSYLGGFDLSEEAVALARKKAPTADVYRGDIRDPEFHVDRLDLVTSLDVIYIPGVERSIDGLRRLAASLRSGGLLVLNLPAFDWLYSEHDVAIHTSERYTVGSVRALLEALGLDVAVLSYRLCAVFPLVVLLRLPSILRVRAGRLNREAKSDLYRVPGRLLNELLFRLVRIENGLISRNVRLPWGSSVFAIGKKR